VSPLAWAGFVLAGAVGAPVRYLVDDAIATRAEGVFPWGTLAINVSGSFLLGILTGLVLFHGFPATLKVIAGTGFCGAYTTFSTFTYETVRLVEEGAVNEAVRNALASLVLGAAAAGAGLALAAL
jgi:CrcB protein